ncbi:hypothetical protein SGO_0550 [Streptococcus gordonii str. Challis substr. CH1]|uniref:Uncharacterized protein n=1 Tax=Streptococcus gordonii (strain Challis / ATCC 35105 / BCRC 15272 / CH1 / DL1 / V288) TaxID=467705 RepID=A8AVQ6_STRGC|nr:hypothetical protein SGO_0550 [Streptococcus gordonii str. Challis substr. CH1]
MVRKGLKPNHTKEKSPKYLKKEQVCLFFLFLKTEKINLNQYEMTLFMI